MSAPLSDEDLEQIALRDELAGDGLVIVDHHAYQDRHVLLVEVRRLREINARRRGGRPAAN